MDLDLYVVKYAQNNHKLYAEACTIRTYIRNLNISIVYNEKITKLFNFISRFCSAWCGNRDTKKHLIFVLSISKEVLCKKLYKYCRYNLKKEIIKIQKDIRNLLDETLLYTRENSDLTL